MPHIVPGFDRLTVEADKLDGQPCIRGYRLSAEQVLDLLAAGQSSKRFGRIPFVEPEDVRPVLGYAAGLARETT